LYTSIVINPELEFELEISDRPLGPPGAEPGPEKGAAKTARVRWEVTGRLRYFEGHFPGFPVLPGVATIDVTLEAIRRVLGKSELRLKTLQNAKFLRPIRPGDSIEINLLSDEAHPGDWKAEWKILSKTEEPVLVAELALRTRLDRE
jgi:hypothetical protein